MVTVACIGVGNMGGQMARHVVEAGHATRVFDVREEAVAPLVELGATAAASPAEAADGADAVVVVVLNDEQFVSVLTGSDGVLSTLSPGSVVLAHSTLALSTVHEMAAACVATGVGYVDAGISGGVEGAEAGTLMIIAGGDEAHIDQARPVLDAYSTRVVHCGPVGAGICAKLGRNLTGYVLMKAVAEGMALAVRGGVEPATFTHILEDSDVLRQYHAAHFGTGAPLEPFDPARPEHAGLESFITVGQKDLHQAIVTGAELGVDLPAARGALPTLGAVFSIDYPTPSELLEDLD